MPEVINLISSDEEGDRPSSAKRPRRPLIESDDEVEFVSHAKTSPRSRNTTVLFQQDAPNGDQSIQQSTPTPSSFDNGKDIAVVSSNRGVRALVDYPHIRFMCEVNPMSLNPSLYCPKCYCFVCDVPASSCGNWEQHAQACDQPKWRTLRAKVRKANGIGTKKAPHSFFKPRRRGSRMPPIHQLPIAPRTDFSNAVLSIIGGATPEHPAAMVPRLAASDRTRVAQRMAIDVPAVVPRRQVSRTGETITDISARREPASPTDSSDSESGGNKRTADNLSEDGSYTNGLRRSSRHRAPKRPGLRSGGAQL